MKTIQRNVAPACLADQPRSQDWYDFMRTPCHVAVDSSLRQEQQGLCCYCELPIELGDSHIEHMEPRSENGGRTYDYANLAISCNGGRLEHCGRYKDDRKRNPNYRWDRAKFSCPHDPATASLFAYLPDGSIAATTSDAAKAEYLIGYLGLHSPRLNERRREHAREIIDTLGDDPDAEVIDWLRGEYLQVDANGCLKQFYSLSKAILEP